MTKTVKAYALFLPEIKQLLQCKDNATLKSFLREINPVDLAEGWKEFTREEQLQLFELLSTRKAVVVFEELDVEDQTALLQALGEQGTDQMVNELPAGEVAHLFRKLPRRITKRLSNIVKKQETIEKLNQILSYPPKTAGALVHTEVVLLKESQSASHALELIRTMTRTHIHDEHILAMLYVTNAQGRLVGYVSLQTLVSAPHDSKVGELMSSTTAIQIPATADQEEAAKLVSKYNLISAPVVDDEGRLVGVLLVDDVIDIIKQEASEDMAKMVGTRAEEFGRKTILMVVRLRLPWLVASIIGGSLVSLVVKHYQGTLHELIALATFMPLIAAMGGNVGAQSATIIVRSLATGRVKMQDWPKAVAYEFAVGVLLGISYGIMVGGFAYVLYGQQLGIFFAMVVALGMLTSMTVASTMGALEPFVFQKMGIDPATATGPLITTITDLVSTTTYLTLATLILL